MNNPRLLLLVLLMGMLPALEGCIGCTHVEMGYVGIEINNCANGAKPALVDVGYHATGACTNIVEYPTSVQTVVWTKNPGEGTPANEEITFTNADQMQISVDISLAYQLLPDRVPAFYAKFRADKLETFTYGFMHNLAREKFDEAAGKYKIENIMGDNAAFVKEVRTALQKDLDPYGVVIAQFGFIGAPRPPQSVVDSINAKATATQKGLQIELEIKQSEATARKQVAQAQGEADALRIKADAQAYANQKLASSLSQTLVDYRRIEKWDGKMPQFQGAGTPIISVGK